MDNTPINEEYNYKSKPFTPMKLEEERDPNAKVLTIRLNKQEQELLKIDMKLLEQAKSGTAIKLLMNIGSQVLHDNLMGNILGLVFKNKRKNKRMGIQEYEL